MINDSLELSSSGRIIGQLPVSVRDGVAILKGNEKGCRFNVLKWVAVTSYCDSGGSVFETTDSVRTNVDNTKLTFKWAEGGEVEMYLDIFDTLYDMIEAKDNART